MINIPVDLEKEASVYLLEFDFGTGEPYRITDASFDIAAQGEVWTSSGRLLSMGDPTRDLESKVGEVGFSFAASDQFFLGVAQSETYRNRRVRLFKCWVDENFQELFTMELVWKVLTNHTFDNKLDNPTVTFHASNWNEGWLKSAGWSTTNESHRSKYPTDGKSFNSAGEADKTIYWGRG